jgi:Spy/CpxP family protein refolding chaperone
MQRMLIPTLFSLALAAGCAADAETDVQTASLEPAATGGEELPPRAERRLARMTEQLELTEEQVALVREAMVRVHSEGHFSRREGHREMRQAMEDILTPEQLERMRAHRGAHRGRRGPHGMRGPHGRRGHGMRMMHRLAEELELDDQQKEQLRAAFREAREARRQSGVHPRDLPREERRALREQHREEMQSRIEAVLRPEQLERFRELRAELEARREQRIRHRRGRGLEGPAPEVAPETAQ